MVAPDFIIVIDTSEQTPFFSGRGTMKNLIITHKNLKPQGGDYTILGFESKIIIERKNPDDFLSSITTDRVRFYKTFPKLASHEVAIIVVEEELSKVLKMCDKKAPKRTTKGKLSARYSDKRQIDPASVKGFITSLASGKHGNIQIFFAPGKQAAEGYVLGVLSKFYERQRG